MVEKNHEFYNNKKYAQQILRISIDKEKDDINKILYYAASSKDNHISIGNPIKIFIPFPLMDYEHTLTDDIIKEASYILARFAPEIFYHVYHVVTNSKTKSLMIESLEFLWAECQEFSKNRPLKTFKEPSGEYNVGNYCCYTISLNTDLARITLDENNRIIEGCYQYNTISSTGIALYGSKEGCNDFGIYNYLLSPQNVKNLSKLICMGDLEEYKKLREMIDPKDPFYRSVIEAGSVMANNIESLVRILNK